MNTALRSREIFALVYTDKQKKKKNRNYNNSKWFRRRVGEFENYLYLLKISSLEVPEVIVV